MVIVETDRMFYLRSMRTYHEQLPRTPITALHDASLPSAEASAPTRYAQQHLTEHLLPPAQLGWKKLWQKQPPTQYAKEFAVRQRVKTLTEQGLFSQAAIREHQARVAAKHKGR